MASQQDYASSAVFYNNVYLTQVTSLGLTTESGQQRVDLLNEGLGGFTPGSGSCSIDVECAVPIGGTEEEFQEDCVAGTYVKMQIPIGKKDYVGKGKLMTVSFERSVSSAMTCKINWSGELAALQ